MALGGPLRTPHRACVHHGLEAVMGSTAWAASVDNVLILNRRERYRLLSTVQRIGPDLDETVVLMDEDTGEVRFGGSRYMVDLQHVVTMMRALVAAAGPDGVGREELLRDVEARRELKLKALQHLTADPTVERLGPGTRKSQYRYRDAREPETGRAGFRFRFPGSRWARRRRYLAHRR